MRTADVDLLCARSVCEALGVAPVPECWEETWAQSEGAFLSLAPEVLCPEAVRRAGTESGLSDEVAAACVACAESMQGNAALRRLVWHCHWLLFLSGKDPQVSAWPRLSASAKSAVSMAYAVAFLSGFSATRAIHRSRGIAAEVTVATVADLELWIREEKRRSGSWGLAQLGWLVHHFQGRLFALGRLQYLPGRYHNPFVFYRHFGSRRVVALAEDGLLMRGDGQFASADGGRVKTGLWLTSLEASAGKVRGHPVSPLGYVAQTQVELPLDQWHEILRPGDPVMTVHIPATGPMDPGSCGQSFRMAVEFFPRHLPDVPYRAFTCQSWLLDPQSEAMAPPPRNIVAFLREWYLHPVRGADDGQTWERLFDVFDGRPPTLHDAPTDTSLRRAVVDFMQHGGRCRSGGSVLFAEDLNWGEQVYRAGMEEPQ